MFQIQEEKKRNEIEVNLCARDELRRRRSDRDRVPPNSNEKRQNFSSTSGSLPSRGNQEKLKELGTEGRKPGRFHDFGDTKWTKIVASDTNRRIMPRNGTELRLLTFRNSKWDYLLVKISNCHRITGKAPKFPFELERKRDRRLSRCPAPDFNRNSHPNLSSSIP